MAATRQNPIVFYDVFSKQGPWSPNTFKTRLTLNYKRLPYRVEYLALPDIESKLKELGVPPSSNNPVFPYTLPMIADPSSEPEGNPTYIVDSFDIAIYLDNRYPTPDHPAVFPPGTRVMQQIAADHIAGIGMLFAPIALPLVSIRSDLLDERSQEYFTRTRSKLFGTELPKLLDKAPENWDAAKARWDNLDKVFGLNQGGPFMMGHRISFVDFVIGGIIHLLQKTEGGQMGYWKKMAEWHGGRWETLWEEISRLEADSIEVV